MQIKFDFLLANEMIENRKANSLLYYFGI